MFVINASHIFSIVGSGSTGAALTFATLACGYALLMASGALLVRIPPKGWTPAGWTPPTGMGTMQHSVHHSTAWRTPQFYLLWTTLFGNAIAGVTIISTAKTMMSDVFTGAYPLIVTVRRVLCGDSLFVAYIFFNIFFCSINRVLLLHLM